jgi:hypothetical protein
MRGFFLGRACADVCCKRLLSLLLRQSVASAQALLAEHQFEHGKSARAHRKTRILSYCISYGFWCSYEKNHILVGKYRKIIQSSALTH